MMNFSAFKITNYFDKKVLRNAGVLLLLFFIFIFVCFLPTCNNVSTLKNKLKVLENNVVHSKRKIVDYPKFLKEKDSCEAFVAEAQKKLIFEGDKTKLIGDISDLARKNKIKIISLKPVVPTQEYKKSFYEYFKPLRYEIMMEASYHNFGVFLNELESFSVLLFVEKFQIEPKEDIEKVLDVKLVLDTYAKI